MPTLNLKTILMLGVAIVFLSGCAQTHYVSVERSSGTNLPYNISLGDTVKVITTEAHEVEFTVTSVGEKSLIGDGTEVQYDEIWKLEKKEVDKPTTAAIFASSTLMLVLTLGIVGAAIVL